MAKTTGVSTVINAIKAKMKGAWEESRKAEPKAKGLTTLPGGIQNGIGRIVGATLKMTEDKGKGSAPMVTLKFIVREPIDFEGAQIFKFYIFRERTGDFPKSIREIGDEFSSDLQFLGVESGETGLPDIDNWPEMLADLQTTKPYFVYNTWKPPGDGPVQIFIQRQCTAAELKAFASNPTDVPEDAEALVAAAEAGEPAPKAPPTRKGPPPKAPPKAPPPSDEPEVVSDEPEPVQEPESKKAPEPGDRCYVQYKGEQLTCDITAVDEAGSTCICKVDDLQGDPPTQHSMASKTLKITFEQLEKWNPDE